MPDSPCPAYSALARADVFKSRRKKGGKLDSKTRIMYSSCTHVPQAWIARADGGADLCTLPMSMEAGRIGERVFYLPTSGNHTCDPSKRYKHTRTITSADDSSILQRAPASGKGAYRTCTTNGILGIGKDCTCPEDGDDKFVDPVVNVAESHVQVIGNNIAVKWKERVAFRIIAPSTVAIPSSAD